MMHNSPTPADQALLEAVREGDEDAALRALGTGASINTLLPEWEPIMPFASLLILASERNSPSMIRLLLAAGHHVDNRGQFQYTPLQCAIHLGHNNCVKELLAAGPHLEATDQGNTALHIATRRNNVYCIKALIDAGADVNARDNMQRTPLHVSVLGNSTEALRLLLASGCNVSAVNSQTFTAMHIAALSGNEAGVQELYKAGLNPETREESGLLAEDVAEVWGSHNTAWLLRKLPKLKTDSHTQSDTHSLMARSWQEYESEGHKTLEWVKKKDFVLLEASLPKNRDSHYQDVDGLTPLHWAAKLGFPTIVRSLIDNCKVLPWALTHDGESPADLARQAGHQHLSQVITEAAGVQQPSDSSTAPSALYEQLLREISKRDDPGAACQLLCHGSPLEATGDFYTSAVVLAITCNRPRILSLLLAAGAPLTTCSAGLSLLQVAWRSHDVTIRVKLLVTRHLLHALQAEKRRIREEDRGLHDGVEHLMKTMRGPRPWQTSWPPDTLTNLTSLMVMAASNNCPLAATFLRQAGAKCFLRNEAGVTGVHAAMQARHWKLAELLLTHLGGCLYIPDSAATLPLHMLPEHHSNYIEDVIYHQEKHKLEDIIENAKDKEEKDELQAVLDIYKYLYIRYRAHTTMRERQLSASPPQGSLISSYSLLVSCRNGLLQLTYLLITVGGLNVDVVVDATHDSTALHQAASHGNSASLALLLSLGASPLKQDRYGHTPAHFAAMFGHDTSYEQLKVHMLDQPPLSVAGTIPSEVSANFTDYLYRYRKIETNSESAVVFNNPSEAIKKILNFINIRDVLGNLNNITVDFTKGEAMRVKMALTNEVQIIMDKISSVDSLYKGELTTVGSSSDGSRLYAPDEYDISVVLSNIPGVDIEIVEQSSQQAALSGHRLRVVVKSEHPRLQGNALINTFYELVRSCLETHAIENRQLSLVPPGVTRTQVGVSLTFAWQGKDYPLLLINIDLVPVLAVPWPPEVRRPPLTPDNITQVYLSNTADGEWRCSFAGAEAEVLSRLSSQERQVYIACKTLLSHLKAEPWMPKEVKNNYIWWDSRRWKIMIPAGFAMKNSFLNQLQLKREQQLEWYNEDLLEIIITIMKNMCQDFHDPSTGVESLVPAKIYAYFGGEFEKPKLGEGAPQIIEALRGIQKQ
ncbi:serine/threonine-protein phosphatase 6 regulatory ankyrin repeat subunit B isoform X2 [Cherax quadricarinatus]|uniref:serine/threonine-protein phosphatase 6 regulatory ankyrin repeat subunit B isoform X2 n=1 Tax=Cherax quadricarinatus TaxID=27406 RepID=UPI00387E845F